MLYRIRLLLLGALFFVLHDLHGQRFGGGLKLAGTLSQIDGDGIAGFNKPGYEAGVYGQARLSKLTALEMHFSYNLRGSHYGKNDIDLVKFNLHYVDIPVLFVVKDWLNVASGEDYYRMHFFGGVSLGRLISSDSFSGLDESFKKTDVSWILGATYFYAKNWGVTGKYTRSFTPLHSYFKGNQKIKMISYFLSLGLQYQFN